MESAMYKIEELKNSMVEGINNASNVKNQQDELAKILKNAKNTKNDFNPLIKSIGETSDNLQKQIDTMNVRLECVNDILNIYDKGFKENASAEDKFKSQFADEIITKCLYAMGIVKDEEMNSKKAE